MCVCMCVCVCVHVCSVGVYTSTYTHPMCRGNVINGHSTVGGDQGDQWEISAIINFYIIAQWLV